MTGLTSSSGARASTFDEPLFPGALIAGRYELERPLSHGGMGWLWVARDTVLDVSVAIKLIRAELRSDSIAERMLLEARLAARIEHPAIVRVLALDANASGVPFIVMELLEGEDLRSVLDREGRLSGVDAVRMLLPIASALTATHARGVLHRDLKPDNVFIASINGRPQPKLVDFGIAAPLDRQRRRLTGAGAVVGSPDYLSPEQALGRSDVDERADVWGFCCMLYECVTGVPPFARSPAENLLYDVVEKPIDSFAEHGIDEPELWSLMARGLAKDREERWPSMQALGVALARWLGDRGVYEDVCGRSLGGDWHVRESVPPLVLPTPVPAPVREPAQRPVERGVRLRPPLIAFAALALLLIGASAHASSIFVPRAPAIFERRAQTLDLASVQRHVAPVVESVAPAPARERARPPKKSRPRAPVRPPDFDPVLGF